MLLVLGFAFARLLPPGTQDKTAGSSDRSFEGALGLESTQRPLSSSLLWFIFRIL